MKAINSRKAALELVDKLFDKTLNELLSCNMIHQEAKQRSVAADTRHFQQQIQRTNNATAQVKFYKN